MKRIKALFKQAARHKKSWRCDEYIYIYIYIERERERESQEYCVLCALLLILSQK
jgi:hypothetical protein